MPKVHLSFPYKYEPRWYQIPLFNAISDGYRYGVSVLHRRAGKDKTAWNIMIKEAWKRVGGYYYFLPSYAQGRKIIWDGMDRDSFPFLGHIPEAGRESVNSTEMKIKLKNGSLIQIVGSDNIDCYSEDTEILTENGWRLFKDLVSSDRVASLVDKKLKYIRPIKFVNEYYDGDMVSIKNGSIDLLVTPNHRFYVKSQKGIYGFKTAAFLEDHPHGYRIPSTCGWSGKDLREFKLPPVRIRYICGKGRKVDELHTQTFEMSDWVAFLGIFLAEGSTFTNNSGAYRVCITQKDIQISNEIIGLLERMDLKYRRDGNNFVISHKSLFEYCRQFGTCDKKYIPKNIKNLNKKYLRILFDWLIKGDGSISPSGQIHFYSTSKRLVDDFQEIAIKLGYSTNEFLKKQNGGLIGGRRIIPRKLLYEVTIRKSLYRHLYNSKTGSYIKKVPYIGKIYCVQVEPSNVVLVRRNGKAVWSGNSVVGTNPVGCVFSEYSLQDPRGWKFVSPILEENDGWAHFIYTPRGHNHSYRLYNDALVNEDWFCERWAACVHPVFNPNGEIPATNAMTVAQIDKQLQIHDADFIAQEYFVSFEAAISGAYYANELRIAKKEKRICKVPVESGVPVHTAWDLGMADSTVIWFYQNCGREVHVVDYYENSGEGLAHYTKVLDKRGYRYGRHYGPHDIEVRELGTGKSRKEMAGEYGLKFEVAPKLGFDDGVEAGRRIFQICWFDSEKCERGLEALHSYQKVWDNKNETFKMRPLHNWASHGADGFRVLAITHRWEADYNVKQLQEQQRELVRRRHVPGL